MKKSLHKAISTCIRPFYGSGLGNYFPFKQLNHFHQKLGKKLYFWEKNEIKMRTNEGFWICLHEGKTIDDTIINLGFWEPDISKLIRENLKKWDTFVDIGANIGYFSLLGSEIVGENGKILAFEPSSKNFAELTKNIALNNFSNISAIQYAASNVATTKNLFYNPTNPGGSSLVENLHSGNESESIETIVLDDFLRDEKIDLIKMDIEWYEYFAILGMKNLLAKNHLKMIFEYSPTFYEKLYPADFAQKSVEILDILTEIGFLLYFIDYRGKLEPISNNQKFFENLYAKREQVDIFCSKEKIC